MNADVLGTTRRALVEVEALQELLASDARGIPQIFTGTWAPTGAERPYLIVGYRTFPTETPNMRRGPMTIDAFTDGPSSYVAEQIKDAVIGRLDTTILTDEEHYFRFSEVQDDGPAPTESNDVAHWTTVFEVRWWRQAFVQERYG